MSSATAGGVPAAQPRHTWYKHLYVQVLAAILAGIDGPPAQLTLIEVETDPLDLPTGMPQWGRETSAADYHAQLAATPVLPLGGLP